MSPDQARDYWKRYDELIARAPDEQTKLLLEALKLNAEMMNSRIAPLEHILGTIARK